jgi:Fic family protein
MNTKKRKYESTHKWLTFLVNLKPASPDLWMMLGECQSKCEHLSRVPLRPDVAEELNKLYIAKGVLATTAIEGNTMTEEEVQRFLDGKLKLPPSREYLGQEITNIADECNRILEIVASGAVPVLNIDRIKELNKQVLDKLSLNDEVVPGEIRKHEVGVALYRGAPAEDCVFLLERLCKWLNSTDHFGEPNDPRAIVYAIIKAVLSHLYLAWIHPFGDGNGRTARLIEFQILISSGLPGPAAHLLSNHYNLTRTEYYRQLHNASKSGGDVIPFIHYAVQGFLDGLRGQLQLIRDQVLDVVWQSYVLDQFIDRNSPVDLRRRTLVEELSRIVEPKSVPLDRLQYISQAVTKLYANKTAKTLYRDVRELFKMKLLRFDGKGIRANQEYIQVFLPMKSVPQEQKKGRKKNAA